jgi:hypothetical protein
LNDRNKLVSNIENVLELKEKMQYKSIIVDTKNDIKSVMYDDSVVVFDKMITNVSFDVNKFPYTTQGSNEGVNELRMRLTKLTSKSDDDFVK